MYNRNYQTNPTRLPPKESVETAFSPLFDYGSLSESMLALTNDPALQPF